MSCLAAATASEISTEREMGASMESLQLTDQKRLTEAYVVVPCGLDEQLYSSLADDDVESKEVASILKKMLDLKNDTGYQGLNSYQKRLTPLV